MMQGRDFIVFSDDWGRHPFSCQHIMQHFMPGNRVLWVNTIGMRLPRLSLYDMRRAAEKLRSWVFPARQGGPACPEGLAGSQADILPEGLRVISPVMIPLAPLPPVRAFNRRSVVDAVTRNAREMGFRDPVLLATVPNAADYVGHCGESLVVYYCVDEFTLWPGMNLPDMVRDLEADLMRSADLVVAVSDALVNAKGNGRTPTRLLTHGVDAEHFAMPAAPQPLPERLAAVRGPVVGFFGLIDRRFDIDLVAGILEARPQWTVVLIGAQHIPLDRLERFTNCIIMPAVPYSELPRYAARFDVAIVPYVTEGAMGFGNPLKLREYLATGRPVVSTPVGEAGRFGDVLRIASTGAGFVEAIESELADPSDVAARLAVLEGETWRDKAGLLSSWIEECLAAREAEAAAPGRVPGTLADTAAGTPADALADCQGKGGGRA